MITNRNASHMTRKPMNMKCWKCRAALICVSGAFSVAMQKCDRCHHQMLSVIDTNALEGAPKGMSTFTEEIIDVTCDKYPHAEGVLCAKCAKRKESQNSFPGG